MQLEEELPESPAIFYFDRNHRFLVLSKPDGVIIMTSRGNVPAETKSRFVRHLAAEGFIPDRYAWFSETQPSGVSPVEWVAAPLLDSRHELIRKLPKFLNGRTACSALLILGWVCLVLFAGHRVHHYLGL